MAESKEICWHLTSKDNQNFRYYHKFTNIDKLNIENNKKILDRISSKDGIKSIIFMSEEALLYPNFLELLELAKDRGIKCELLINDLLFTINQEMIELFKNVDSLTISIDSIDYEINKRLGRGDTYLKDIKSILEILREYDLNINTVVSRLNLDKLDNVANFLEPFKIKLWRIFKFMPNCENKKEFEITKSEFNIAKNICICEKERTGIEEIQFLGQSDVESKYISILPNGDIIITRDSKNICIGNALENGIFQPLEKSKIDIKPTKKLLKKIRTIIAYNDDSVRNSIVNVIKKIEFVDIVGVTSNGKDTYKKIIDLQPEIAFMNYSFDDMNGLDIIKKTKEQLKTKISVFNIIGKDISEKEYYEFINIVGIKLNTILTDLNSDNIVNVLNEYKSFIENKKNTLQYNLSYAVRYF